MTSRPLHTIREHLLLVLLSLILVISCVIIYRGWRACERQGGKYVRGLYKMECVKG